MRNFLIIYDRPAGRIIRRAEYPTSLEALHARFEAEREFRGQDNIEVVTLGADSWEALKLTHARYFMTVQEIAAAALERGI